MKKESGGVQMELHEEFYNWRIHKGLTQGQAAALIGMGRTSYNRFEKYGIAGDTNRRKFSDFYLNHENEFDFGGE